MEPNYFLIFALALSMAINFFTIVALGVLLFMLFQLSSFTFAMAEDFKKKFRKLLDYFEEVAGEEEQETPKTGLMEVPGATGTYDPRFVNPLNSTQIQP